MVYVASASITGWWPRRLKLRRICTSLGKIRNGTYKIQSTALNASDPPCSNPANTALRTAAKYSVSLRPFSPANSVNNIYRESATTFAKSKACRTLLNKTKCAGKKEFDGWLHEDMRMTERKGRTLVCVFGRIRGAHVGAG